MSIELGSSNLNKGLNSSSAEAKLKTNSATTSSTNATAPTTTDNVSLSVTAKALGELEAQINQSPSVDSERVAAVRASIENGQYQIDSSAIASGLLAQDELLG